ncbi:hypothetical protein [Virgibacillus alimentarius]|uniref:hypothetical protein n=1 Tax=Virgibacillus alimentarius TaxID=698769 RepID=UPI0004930F4C|nr:MULTISPECIES: hypothetical protein [Virgibacillus]HLR67040.1 hypothetical protein [Virgibacillus sp.]
MNRPISRLRHKNLRKLVELCREKEDQGWECIRPIQRTDRSFKHFNIDKDKTYEFQNTDTIHFYEAVYRRKSNGE